MRVLWECIDIIQKGIVKLDHDNTAMIYSASSLFTSTIKILKIRTQKLCCNNPKIWKDGFIEE